jgi:hypothetical protein
MRKPVKLCPICLTENTGGLPHRHHREGHRKKSRTIEQISEMARQTIEANQVRVIVAQAVDESRQPEPWADKRTRYHRAYYQANLERRREQTRQSKRDQRMRRRLRTLIAGLCYAVDLGRLTARW